MPSYTHSFKLDYDTADITGDCEFNIDGQASFETNAALPNITVEQQRIITDLFKIMRRFFVQFGAIKDVRFKEK